MPFRVWFVSAQDIVSCGEIVYKLWSKNMRGQRNRILRISWLRSIGRAARWARTSWRIVWLSCEIHSAGGRRNQRERRSTMVPSDTRNEVQGCSRRIDEVNGHRTKGINRTFAVFDLIWFLFIVWSTSAHRLPIAFVWCRWIIWKRSRWIHMYWKSPPNIICLTHLKPNRWPRSYMRRLVMLFVTCMAHWRDGRRRYYFAPIWLNSRRRAPTKMDAAKRKRNANKVPTNIELGINQIFIIC